MAEDSTKALTDFWSAQGAAMLEAQQTMTRSMMGGLKGLSTPATEPGVREAAESMMSMWSAATGLSADMANRFAQATGGQKDGVFDKIADPRQWMAGSGGLDEVLAGLADSPRLADLFDVERRYAGVMRHWNELRQRSVEHQQVLLDTWMGAGKAYSAALAGKSLEPKQAMALWTETANRAMLEAQRSEPYLVSQRAVIRASTALRLAQSDLSEHIGKQFGLPTRSEMDDVHRSLTEMRRELRRVRRELDGLRAAKPPVTATPPATPPATRARKPAGRKPR